LLVDSFVGWLVGSFVGWFVRLLVGSLADLSDRWLVVKSALSSDASSVGLSKSKEDFNLTDDNHQAEVLYFHDHGLLKETVPSLVIAVAGDALILRRRGSATIGCYYEPGSSS
jgi:hypothetical protein